MSDTPNNDVLLQRDRNRLIILACMLFIAVLGISLLFTTNVKYATVTKHVLVKPGNTLPGTFYDTTYVGPVDKDGEVLAFAETKNSDVHTRNLTLAAGDALPFDMKGDETLAFDSFDDSTLIVRYTRDERVTKPDDAPETFDSVSDGFSYFLGRLVGQ